MVSSRNQILKNLTPPLIVIGMAFWSVWPLVINPARVADYGKDGWLFVVIRNNWQEKITDYIRGSGGSLQKLFDADFYYPNSNVIAYSDMHFISSLISYIPAQLSNNPGVSAGVTMVFGQVMTMFLSYIIFSKISGSKWGGAAGAIVFGLSQIRWHYQVHMQMWNLQWWLLSLWMIMKWKETNKNIFWYTACLILGMQVWESLLPVYFGITTIAIYIIFNAPSIPPLYQRGGRNGGVEKMFGIILSGLIIFATVGFLPIRAYWQVGQEMGFVRSIRDAANGGMAVNDLWGVFASPGLYILFVIIIYKFLISNKYQNYKFLINRNIFWLLCLMVFSLVLALGPTLKWSGRTVKLGGRIPVPLPYAAAYYLVPGWNAFRVPSRWIVVSAWAAGGMIAVSINASSIPPLYQRGGRYGGVKKKIGYLGCILVAVVGGTHLVKYADLPTPGRYPEIYKQLVNIPGEVVLVLPGGNENSELESMFYNTLSKKKLVGGYSGFIPVETANTWKYFNGNFPGPEAFEKGKKMGIDYVIWKNRIYDVKMGTHVF